MLICAVIALCKIGVFGDTPESDADEQSDSNPLAKSNEV